MTHRDNRAAIKTGLAAGAGMGISVMDWNEG
jgi:hypothetical protein